jgi:serine/threonine-protein kinase
MSAARMSSDPLPNDATITALDRYVARLQAGERPSKSELLAAHPALASVLECLDVLENLAPPAPVQRGPATANELTEAPTLAEPRAVMDAGEAPGEERQGSDFGKFELLEELGRGGMGVVYKARQKDLGRLVALKMILRSQLDSAEMVRRFHDEARAAAGVQHPNITAVYEAGQIHGQPYFAMQYVGGPSLASKLRHGPLPPETTARIVAAVARAVAHLHQHGIVHRDLKPGNILLDEHGQPYVTDFGLVKLLEGNSHQTTSGAIVGTPSYMSPEQAAGQSTLIGPRSDVYSIGAILYECLTGRPPFRAATQMETLMHVLENEPIAPHEFNPQVPRDLESICLRCMEKSPERRYANAAAVADNLERYLNGEPVEGLTPGLWPRLGRWVRREPALAARLGALAVSLTLIQVNYHLTGGIQLSLHLLVVGLLLLWGVTSFVFQRLTNSGRWSEDLPFAWAGADLLLWTFVLLADGEAPAGPLAVGYPCLIAASGLWFRARLVWFTTILSLLSYAAVLTMYRLDDGQLVGIHKHLIVGVALLATGFVVAYQVNRVRALSRYYERRPFPD